MSIVNKDYRVDLLLVSATADELLKVQQKLNQWITTQQLIKYQSSVVGDKVLFEIVRVKQEGQ